MPRNNHRPGNHETARQHLVARVPTARADDRVAAVRALLAGRLYDYTDTVFVLDDNERLLGLVPMTTLLAAAAEQPLHEIQQEPPATAHPGMDQEHVASAAIRHNVVAVPVLDEHGRLLGVVPPQALLAVLRHEHVEDLHRLAGIRRETTQARHAIEAPPVRRVRDRLPWLLVGFAGSMLATFVVARFEHALAAHVAVAFFIPGIVYLADAIGTQTEAIAVRGLSLSHASLGSLVAGELRTGLIIGVLLGALSFPGIWWIFGDVNLALAVALALVVAGTAATTIGLLFPWLLARLGRDPAYGSGPIATVIQDVLSLLIYFLIVTVLVT